MPNYDPRANMGNLFSGAENFWNAFNIPRDYPNPANAANPYYNKIPGTLAPYFQPFIGAGKDALSDLQKQYGQLLGNPSEMIAKFGAGYQESPGYQFQTKQALQAANNAAAAGGMAGSPAEQQSIAGTVNNLANEDYNQYLKNVMGLYGTGLSGEQGLERQGYGASTQFGEDLARALMSQGNLAYTGQENENEMRYGGEGARAGLEGEGLGDIGEFLAGLFL